jgi:hypothetical protein
VSLALAVDVALEIIIIIIITKLYDYKMPIMVAARSKAWVCGRSLAGIAGSNPAGNMDFCLM